MAPIGGPTGGGQAGFGSGGSFTGPAEALEVIGDHAYAYAAMEAASTSDDTRLDFTTGNYYFVGRLTCNGSADPSSVGEGNTTVWTLSLNGTDVSRIVTETVSEDMPSTGYNEIIIAPYTEVKVLSHSNASSADRLTSCIMTGRIYR